MMEPTNSTCYRVYLQYSRLSYLSDLIEVARASNYELYLWKLPPEKENGLFYIVLCIKKPHLELNDAFDSAFRKFASNSEEIHISSNLASADLELTDLDVSDLAQVIVGLTGNAIKNLEIQVSALGNDLSRVDIRTLDLPATTAKKLLESGITNVQSGIEMLRHGQKHFHGFPQFDSSLFDQLRRKLQEHGYWPNSDDKLISDLDLDPLAQWSLSAFGVVLVSDLVKLLNEKGGDFFLEQLQFDQSAFNNLIEKLRANGFDVPQY